MKQSNARGLTSAMTDYGGTNNAHFTSKREQEKQKSVYFTRETLPITNRAIALHVSGKRPSDSTIGVRTLESVIVGVILLWNLIKSFLNMLNILIFLVDWLVNTCTWPGYFPNPIWRGWCRANELTTDSHSIHRKLLSTYDERDWVYFYTNLVSIGINLMIQFILLQLNDSAYGLHGLNLRIIL